uniref:Exonuclease domain-containing protein n=1 Tax=Jaculus jaculus TaxID=51337 RepID=A0A8C5LDR2_JACJA
MRGGSLSSRLLRGAGGSHGQFGARGIRGGSPSMVAGESMAQRMVWVDLEMTGLDIEKDQIIEMACLITDSGLNILAEGPNLTIKQPDDLLDRASLEGNSVHADKFLDKYMPQFMKHLHYRIIDVSTVKELCRRWYPEEYKFAPKKAALDDISESIKELQCYRNNIFKNKTDEKKRKIIEKGENEKTVS